ncbi:MAG: hypothetical protein Q8O19_03790, partial [Rectinemataceae bacterium]|nr:hypothetical protein [Rectinemataceae bacterium]
GLLCPFCNAKLYNSNVHINTMAFVRYRKSGKQEYAYEVTSYWDKEKKRCRQKVKYLGVVVDKKYGIFEKRLQKKYAVKLFLDFGDSHLVNLTSPVSVDILRPG